MTPRLRIILTVLVVLIIVLMIKRIHRKKLSIGYSLLWLLLSFVMLLAVIFPELVYGLADLIGIDLPLNMLLLGFAFFSMMMLFYLTGIVSRDNDKLRSLTQQLGLLEKRVRELETEKAEADNNRDA